MDKNYILGSITIALIIGGTAYAIKRSYDKKKLEEEAITVAEAREIVKQYNPTTVHPMTNDHIQEDGSIDMAELKEECRVEADWNASFVRPADEEVYDEDDEYIDEHAGNGFYDDVNFDTPLADYMTEEDKKLRHEPNSVDALQQYIKMELAEWVPMEDTYQTMLKLFDFPFHPQNDGDHMMMTKIIDHKAQFFGITSRWTKNVTYADVVLRFGRLAAFNLGECVRYWVDYILEFNDLHHTTTSNETGELIERLNSHTYFNPRTNTYGLFGLSPYHYEQALSIASENIDRSLTYEIEFEELMKSVIS